MKISRTKFIVVFVISAFAFQFITNSLLGPEVRGIPSNGDWFPTGSPVAWKTTVASIIYPVKFIVIGPVALLKPEPDSAPPVFLVLFTLYWTPIAFILHVLLSKIIPRKKE